MKTLFVLLGLALLYSVNVASVGGHVNAVSHQNTGGGGAYAHAGGHGGGGHYQQDYYAKPNYQYSYGVNDHYTKDEKHAAEQRDGDNVKGHYALREPDGSWRTVNYVADYNGFRANVVRTPNANGHGHQG